MTLDRVRGAFVGLAIGDAAGWPSARHRFGLLAAWTRRLSRELDLFAEEHRVTTLPVPFALNQPVAPLTLGPSDDAEWLAWTARTIDRDRAEAFGDLTDRTDIRARISVRSALDNLGRGKRPPVSGHDNPHHFDDAAVVRAVAFGAAHPGDPGTAARRAGHDAEVTNAIDGVAGARAMAAAVAVAVTGAGAGEATAAAVGWLPEDSAIGERTRAALALAREDPFALVPELEAIVCDHVYSYGVAAADTVPAALALARVAGRAFGPAVGAATCLSPLADSLPALTGALAGAHAGFTALPSSWRERARRLAGCCLPELAGMDLRAVADDLVATTT